MNYEMLRFYNRTNLIDIGIIQRLKIKICIGKFVSRLHLFRDQEQKWVVDDKGRYRYCDIITLYKTLTSYEWECNEMCFFTSIISYRLIEFALNCIEKHLKKNFVNTSFIVTVIVQEGQYSNINVRLNIYRKNELYLGDDLNQFTEPILYRKILT